MWNRRRWLDVHGKKAKVRFVNGDKDKDLELGKLDGCLLRPDGDRTHWLIKIDSTEPESTQRQSLLHELIHVGDYISGGVLSEAQVAVVSQVLFDAFDKNPGLAAWIGGSK